jgi:hypothetical protein
MQQAWGDEKCIQYFAQKRKEEITWKSVSRWENIIKMNISEIGNGGALTSTVQGRMRSFCECELLCFGFHKRRGIIL